MTRLLFPSAFGQIAAASSLLTGLVLLTDVGIRTVILQSPRGDRDDFLRTGWTMQTVRGSVLWLMLIVVCGVISAPIVRSKIPTDSVFSNPQFFAITVALGFGLVTGGFVSTKVDLNQRRLNLKPLFLMDLTARLISLPFMIAWAWIAPSVWALVGGALMSSVVRLTLSHVALPGPRMSFRWNKDYVREIVHFGKWVNVSSIASFLGGQSDRFILGLLVPASEFGLYAIARTLIDTSQAVFEQLNNNLAFPALSEVIRRGEGGLKNKYYRLRLPFDCVAPFLGGVLTVAGSLVVSILFDKRYAHAGEMVQLLAIWLPIYPSLLIGTAFTSNGEPYVGAAVTIIQSLALIICLSVGFLIDGLVGAVGGIALHKLAASAALLFMGRRRQWIDFVKELRVVPVFILGAVAGELILAVARIIHLGAS